MIGPLIFALMNQNDSEICHIVLAVQDVSFLNDRNYTTCTHAHADTQQTHLFLIINELSYSICEFGLALKWCRNILLWLSPRSTEVICLISLCQCSAGSMSPWSGKKTPQNNATCTRGIYYWLEPGPPALTKGVRMKGPETQFSRVFIRSKKKAAGSWRKQIGYTAGSWRKRIGYTVARQFLLAQRGAFSFPLIGSLFSC